MKICAIPVGRGSLEPMRARLAFLFLVGLQSCGGAALNPPSMSRPSARAGTQRPTTQGASGDTVNASDPGSGAQRAASHSLSRSAVHAVVAQGLGYFLQRVDLEDRPVFEGGRFHGFRIARLRDEKFWDGVDIKAGDVVTAVNGLPIERPEQAQTAFDSLEVSSELRVAYERAGEGRELVYAIVDDM